MLPRAPVRRPGPLVEVLWTDIFTTSGWQEQVDLDAILSNPTPGMPTLTVGYLIALTRDRVITCSSSTDDNAKGEITVIPRGCVKKIHRLSTRRSP